MRVVNGHIAKSHPGEAESAQCAGTALIDIGMNIVISARVCNQDIVFGDSVQTIKVIEVGTSTTDKAISAIGKNLNNIGVVSLDSLFCPYVIGLNWEDDAVLPHWEEPNDPGINSTNLNPFNPDKSMVDANKYFNEGPNLGFYNNAKSVGPDSVDDLWQYGNIRRRETIDLDKIRSVGFKAPIILTGWGYDTNDKPVPADIADPDAFASDAFRNPSLWKSGPLDVRWDDDRKVWTGGNGTGVPRIHFQILATDFTVGYGALGCDHVVAVVTHISCGGAGVAVGSEVKIYDPEYCHFNLPINLLTGLTGTATWMDSASYQAGLDLVIPCVNEIHNNGCFWVIDTLCCSEEETISE